MSNPNRYRLSKSKIAAFEHCPLRLWLQIHRRELARVDADTLKRFQFGHDVGKKARFLVPDGILVDAMPDVEASLERTRELLTEQPPRPIFEATFQRDDVVVCVDILEPDGEGSWHAIEVKAARQVRPYQLADLATQIWVMQGSSVPIARAFIRHLASPLNWNRLDIGSVRFQNTDVTERIRRFLSRRPDVIASARTVIRDRRPVRKMGRHCTHPFACEFQHHCRDFLNAPLLALAGGDCKLPHVRHSLPE